MGLVEELFEKYESGLSKALLYGARLFVRFEAIPKKFLITAFNKLLLARPKYVTILDFSIDKTKGYDASTIGKKTRSIVDELLKDKQGFGCGRFLSFRRFLLNEGFVEKDACRIAACLYEIDQSIRPGNKGLAIYDYINNRASVLNNNFFNIVEKINNLDSAGFVKEYLPTLVMWRDYLDDEEMIIGPRNDELFKRICSDYYHNDVPGNDNVFIQGLVEALGIGLSVSRQDVRNITFRDKGMIIFPPTRILNPEDYFSKT